MSSEGLSLMGRQHTYPQVRVRAAALIDVPVATMPEASSVADALRLARRRNTRLLAAGTRCVLRDDLSRAEALGLGALRAVDLARAVPSVEATADEVTVRRVVGAGWPFVAIRDRDGIAGAVAGAASRRQLVPVASLGARLARWLPRELRTLLATVAEIGAAEGGRTFAVGGLVRDFHLGGPVRQHDLDIVVEGDALRVARRLADRVGGAVVEHRRFLTASVEAPGVGRVDVVTARTERYERPGALPRVTAADIARDLGRRDFSINAMAIELDSGRFGLLDPEGGRGDLARRRLRVLHPLSCVEDPTRMFRAARYAVRLGLRPDPTTRAAQALALRLAPYEALSGHRLQAELARALAEDRAAAVLTYLVDQGVLRTLHPRYRADAVTRRRLKALPPALQWTCERGMDVEPIDLAILALLAAQTSVVSGGAFERLGLTGEPRARLERVLAEAPGLVQALRSASAPSARARLLRPCAPVALAWLWLDGGGGAHRAAEIRRIVEWFSGLERTPVALSGGDLIALGVPRGPEVSRVLEAIRDGRLDRTISDRDGEERLVRTLMAKGGELWPRNTSS